MLIGDADRDCGGTNHRFGQLIYKIKDRYSSAYKRVSLLKLFSLSQILKVAQPATRILALFFSLKILKCRLIELHLHFL